MKSALVFSVLILLTVVDAYAEDHPPYGTWEWTKTETSQDVFTYPADVGYSLQRAFHTDGVYQEFRDEELVAAGTFTYGETEFQGLVIPYVTIVLDGTTNTYACKIFPEGVLSIYYGVDSGGWPSYPIERFVSRPDVVPAEPTSWGAVKLLFR